MRVASIHGDYAWTTIGAFACVVLKGHSRTLAQASVFPLGNQ
jgi:hypothetical protein